MNFIKKYWLIILIIIFSFFLRFWQLGNYPALNADEASNGYDAYSLIQTGMDQHGHPWPITFQSFNDYKPGLYVYIILPFVKVLGLNEWSVRIPGAAFGVLSVLVIYFLVKELFKDEKFAIISALFLAISPWHLQFSRGGWEVNTATFFVLTGLLFFFKSFKEIGPRKKIIELIVSSVFLIASLYTYHATRVVVPLLGLSILVIYRKSIFKNFKPYLIFIITSAVLLIPLVIDLSSPGALSRVAGVGLFADQGPINRINEQRGEHINSNSVFAKVLHNKAVNYGLEFAENWAAHYSGTFLYVSGDVVQRNAIPETGEMYLFDILFVAVGFVFIIRNFDKKWKFIIFWLIVAPIASALTFQAPNALRAQNMVVPLVIISAFGAVSLLIWFQKKNLKLVIWLFVIFVAWQFARYEYMYWVHMAKEYPFSSQYGVKELVEYISQNESKYQKIYITDKYDQPYILFLFYLKYPPQLFQGNHVLTARDQFGFSTVRDFGKFHFEVADFGLVLSQHNNILIAVAPDEVPKGVNIIKKIYGENGYEYFDIIQN